MSRENVEIVRACFKAFSRNPYEPPLDFFDRDIEVWEGPELPGDLAGTGHDNLVRATRLLFHSFEGWASEPERFFDLGERVLVFARFRAIAKGSGIPIVAVQAHLLTLRSGKITRWEAFASRDKAVEAAAGLSE
jgi:ketosteroid isomerase-like protein